MHRETRIIYTADEGKILRLCEAAAAAHEAAKQARNRAISEAVALGLPVRTVGAYAGLSGAQISRLTRDTA